MRTFSDSAHWDLSRHEGVPLAGVRTGVVVMLLTPVLLLGACGSGDGAACAQGACQRALSRSVSAVNVDVTPADVPGRVALQSLVNSLPAGAILTFHVDPVSGSGFYDLNDDGATKHGPVVFAKSINLKAAAGEQITLYGGSFSVGDGSTMFKVAANSAGASFHLERFTVIGTDHTIDVDSKLHRLDHVRIVDNYFGDYGERAISLDFVNRALIAGNIFRSERAQRGGSDVLTAHWAEAILFKGNTFYGASIPLGLNRANRSLVYDNTSYRYGSSPPGGLGMIGAIFGDFAGQPRCGPEAPVEPFWGAVLKNTFRWAPEENPNELNRGSPSYNRTNKPGWACIVIPGLQTQDRLVAGNDCQRFMADIFMARMANNGIIIDNRGDDVLDVTIPLLDADGAPVIDENGEPIVDRYQKLTKYYFGVDAYRDEDGTRWLFDAQNCGTTFDNTALVPDEDVDRGLVFAYDWVDANGNLTGAPHNYGNAVVKESALSSSVLNAIKSLLGEVYELADAIDLDNFEGHMDAIYERHNAIKALLATRTVP